MSDHMPSGALCDLPPYRVRKMLRDLILRDLRGPADRLDEEVDGR